MSLISDNLSLLSSSGLHRNKAHELSIFMRPRSHSRIKKPVPSTFKIKITPSRLKQI